MHTDKDMAGHVGPEVRTPIVPIQDQSDLWDFHKSDKKVLK